MTHDAGVPITKVTVQVRQRFYREGVAFVLDAEPDPNVVVATATVAELVASTEDKVDLVVLELDVDEGDAPPPRGHPGPHPPQLDVIRISAGSNEELPARTYQAGVRSVFPSNAGVNTLLNTKRSLPRPGRAASPKVVHLAERRPVLSCREVEVLCGIDAGSTTRLVANSVGIRPGSVENHEQRVFPKLRGQNQAHGVVPALRRGVVLPTHRGPPPFLPAA